MKKDLLSLCFLILLLTTTCSKDKKQDLDPNLPSAIQDVINSDPCKNDTGIGQGYIIQLYSWKGEYIYTASVICINCMVVPHLYDEKGNQLSDIDFTGFSKNATLIKTVWRCEKK